MMRIKTMIAAAAIAVSTTAVAADMKPAVIYDMGGKFDKSFNEVYNGVKEFTDETGIEVMEFEVTNETQREQNAPHGRTWCHHCSGCGLRPADAISKVAAEFPDTKFSIIDVSWLDAPNLRQYAFKEHEGATLSALPRKSLKDRQGWFCRWHRYRSDPPVWLWLCRRCQIRQCQCRGLPEHDRHNPIRME